VRRALEEELKKRKLEEAREAAKRIGEFFSKIPEEEIVGWIKMARRGSSSTYLIEASEINPAIVDFEPIVFNSIDVNNFVLAP